MEANYFLKLLNNRRSVRKYKDQTIEPDKIAILQEALFLAPTSKNSHPCHFFFVTDKHILTQLSEAKSGGGSFIKDAPLAVVIAADERVSDVWVEDCAIAAITLQYAAESIGLGSCWVQMRKRVQEIDGIETMAEDNIRDYLDLDPHIRILSVITIGYDFHATRRERPLADNNTKIIFK